ncbi:hypothetical protein H0E87_021604 [Populus deltoides]|uniref:Uncharacterized protein n=1 Tax=Populus deltoides TaxID=3696 RepID=A0A8T2XET7_POPDE|nr:hypothetical protein H0E87_021604 [Populus deltoides]
MNPYVHVWVTSQFSFFFDLFSTAKVDLLFMDVSELCSPVFDISAPPTSLVCMLFLICRNVSNEKFRVCLCSRRKPAATTGVYGEKIDGEFYGPGAVVNALFVNG